MKGKFLTVAAILFCAALFWSVIVHGQKSSENTSAAQTNQESMQKGAEVQFGEQAVSEEVKHLVKGKDKPKHLSPDKEYRNVFNPDGLTKLGFTIDPVVQTSADNQNDEQQPSAANNGHKPKATPTPTPAPTPSPTVTPTPTPGGGASIIMNFDGLGVGGGYTPNAAPPDTNGAVGATQYVQWVNEAFAVYDKTTGARLSGPINGNQLFTALGATHPCAVNNDGDPVVQYDKANNRWVMTQFSVTNGSSSGYYECIAISKTSDATGAYNVYAYKEPGFNDYPKVGVGADAYYVTYNMFNGNTFTGARLCGYDRAAMIAGAIATEQCFQLTPTYGGVLPADVDGNIAPPAEAPEYFANFGSNSLNFWKFHVDFKTPTSSTLTGPTTVAAAAFSEACAGGTCIPQLGTSQQLDSLGDRLMNRLAYRHFADGHEAMVVNHSVKPGTGPAAGVRWYEIRLVNGTPSIYQQGTYAIGSDNRWMGSAAMDKVGDIGLAYSVSSSSINPSIRFTSRTPADALGTLAAESNIIAGTGSQGRTLARWGDYSALTVDPVDDCTFWFTTEYLKTSGTFNWSTRIASFKLPTCQ